MNIFAAALSTASILFLPFVLPCTAQAAPYKIGVIVALSGDAAVFGKAAQNGMLLAHDSLAPESKSQITLTFEDDAMKSVNSVSAFRKLVNIDKVNAVVCWSSGSCKSVAPLAEAAKVPLVGIASDAAVSKDRNFAFNFWVTPEALTALLVAEVVKRGYKRIAVALTTQDGSLVSRDAFVDQSRGKLDIVYNEHFPAEVKDFRTAVSRISATKPDAVLNIFMPGQVGVFSKQLRQGGVTVPQFGYEPLEDSGEVTISEGTLVGSIFATANSPTADFLARYTARFPSASIVTANTGHDAVTLLAEAIKKDRTADSVAEYLRTVKDFPGVSGVFSATGDNRFSFPATLKVVEKEGFREF